MELSKDLNEFIAAFQKWKSIGVRANEKIKSHEVTINNLNRELQLTNEKLAESERSLRQKEELIKQYKYLLETYSKIQNQSKQENSSAVMTTGDVVIVLDSDEE